MKEHKRIIITIILILLGIQLFASNDKPLELKYSIIKVAKYVEGRGLIVSEKKQYVKTVILITKEKLQLLYPDMVEDTFNVIKSSIQDQTLIVKCVHTKTFVEWEFAMNIPKENASMMNALLINSDGEGIYLEGPTY